MAKLTKKGWEKLRYSRAAFTLREAAISWVGACKSPVPDMEDAGFGALDRKLIGAALSLAADNSKYARGYQAAIQDALERIEDNPYTSLPCARRIQEHVMLLRGKESDFTQLEDALRSLVLKMAGIPSYRRPTQLREALIAASKCLTQIENKRLHKRFAGHKRDLRRRRP